MDLIQRVCELDQSAKGSVVSEAGLTELQQRMHVPDRIEDWIADRVTAWNDAKPGVPLLVALSGNAGDGKSDLIQRLEKRLPSAEDLRIVPDATHADTPDEDQVATLAEFLSPFADGADGVPCVSLIAMNTGMALSFLEAASKSTDLPTFATLSKVLKRELGVATDGPPVEPDWEYEIVNLDRRSVVSGESPLIDGMFQKLDPDNEEGVLFSEGTACAACEARDWCFVRTNLDLLATPEVRTNLKEQLLGASLAEQLHLTPRSVWDFLSQALTGGADFFMTPEASFCGRITQIAARNAEQVQQQDLRDTHERLLWHLLYESPTGESADRGPVLAALKATDPVRRNGRRAHEAASEVFAVLHSDADEMAVASVKQEEGDGGSQPDPLLARLASLLAQPALWSERDVHRVARGVVRRAAVIGTPTAIAGEIRDAQLDEFGDLLDAYAGWSEGEAPPELFDFNELLLDGIRSIFGRQLGAETYFRQDSFSPASRHPAYVRVPVEEHIQPVPDDDIGRQRAWLAAVRYRPSAIKISIDSGGGRPWIVRADLPLYRLLREVAAGYSASSIDLERFFGLRFACESLGSSNPSAKELVIADIDSGRLFRLAEKERLGRAYLEMAEAE